MLIKIRVERQKISLLTPLLYHYYYSPFKPLQLDNRVTVDRLKTQIRRKVSDCALPILHTALCTRLLCLVARFTVTSRGHLPQRTTDCGH